MVQSTRSRRRDGAGGNGRLGLVVVLALVVLAGHVLMKVIPVRIANAEFADYVEDMARELALQNITRDQLIEEIIADGVRRELNVTEKSITVDTDSKKEVSVSVEYEVVLDMVWGEWTRSYTIEKVNPKF